MTILGRPRDHSGICVSQNRDSVEVDGEVVGFTLCEVDARAGDQKKANEKDNTLNGNLNVYIPGHGQSVDGATSLISNIASRSRSKVLWCIDIDPPKGGDQARAWALIKILRNKLGKGLFEQGLQASTKRSYSRVTIFGWSHGAAEAMIAADKDRNLFEQVVAITPVGLIDRHPSELLRSVVLGGLHDLWDAFVRFDGTFLKVAMIGLDIMAGIVRDFWRSRSLQRVLDDICWASRRVTSTSYGFDGTVVILFADEDYTIRWRDVFPMCTEPDSIELSLEQYKMDNLPMVSTLKVRVLEGNHTSPETNASLYIQTALDLLRQESRMREVTPRKQGVDKCDDSMS